MKKLFHYKFLFASASPIVDGGECGTFTHYAFILTLVGSAFIIFLYLWKKGKLDMDEEPKIRMMDDGESKVDANKVVEKKEDLHE